MDDDFSFTMGGLTLCQTTVFRWCRQDDDSGQFKPFNGGVCACGADRLPVGTGSSPILPERDVQWEKLREPFPPLVLLPPYKPKQKEEK